MYIFDLHIHVKIQCRFPLDQRVQKDNSQFQSVLGAEIREGLPFPPGELPQHWFTEDDSEGISTGS